MNNTTQSNIGMPRINEPAPAFEARTTHGDIAAAEARMNEGDECTDWYFCKKSL